MATSSPTNDYYKACAMQKFTSLIEKFYPPYQDPPYQYPPYPPYQYPPYWQIGYSFDTIIDYLDNIDDTSASDVGNRVLQGYQASLYDPPTPPNPPPNGVGGYDNAWFDDFGWWTIATQRAVSRSYFEKQQKDFSDFMSQCWKRFTGNAPYVWERRLAGTFDNYGPAVDGGVWNEYWRGTPATYPGPKNADPSSGSLEGIQNTVTNAVYLIAAQRLGLTDPDAKAAAEREYNFLSTWLWSQQPELALWWTGSYPNAALVRERVSYFFNGNPAPNHSFQPDWAWTGDQGLILGALTDRMALDPGNYQTLLSRAKELLTAAPILLQDSTGNLMNWTASGNVPDGDESDYGTGSGVFWRNALYAWKNNTDLQTFLKNLKEPDFMKFLKINADTAVKNTTDLTFFTLTNDLAVLVLAAVVLS